MNKGDVSIFLRKSYDEREMCVNMYSMLSKYIALKGISLLLFFVLFFPQVSYSAYQQKTQFSDENWQEYRNQDEGCSFRVPKELKISFTKKRDRQEAVRQLMPFDYVNFVMRQAEVGIVPFELGFGVHWNKYKLSTRAFADSKDVGVRQGVKEYLVNRSIKVTVDGIEGVRDDFTLVSDYERKTYSRVIVPVGDNFFCFLCTLGSDQPVAEYEQVFEKIIQSVKFGK